MACTLFNLYLFLLLLLLSFNNHKITNLFYYYSYGLGTKNRKKQRLVAPRINNINKRKSYSRGLVRQKNK